MFDMTPGSSDNKSDNKFVDISTEMYRKYTFPGGDSVTIDKPQFLNVSTSGHRVLDIIGISHYIPKGWIHLEWFANGGCPRFVK
jgi:hypothetical protein